jgi:hypothetical protein
MKYESPMANVKVFEKWVKLLGQGHKVKDFGTNRKVLFIGIPVGKNCASALADLRSRIH